MAGVDDFTLMEIMGHSDFTMMKRYAHLTPAHKRKVLALFPGWTVESKWHNNGPIAESEEKGVTGRNPQPLVFTGAEGGI